jgi:4'-phosphopantetheinyl transferase
MTSVCYVAPIEWSVLNNADYLLKLPDEEQQQATRYRHPQRLQSFIASRLLLRRCLSLHENREREWRFLRHNQRLILDNTQTALHTSLSHSANWVACVLSLSTHCGIDIEQKKDNSNFMAIAKRFFAAQEYDLFKHSSTATSIECFFRFLDT